MNQYHNIVNWRRGDNFQWNLYRNSYIFIQENVFENVVHKKAAICLGLNIMYTHQPMLLKNCSHFYFSFQGLYSLSGFTSARFHVSKLRDSSLNFSNCSGIWKAPGQQRCHWILRKHDKHMACIRFFYSLMHSLMTNFDFVSNGSVYWQTLQTLCHITKIVLKVTPENSYSMKYLQKHLYWWMDHMHENMSTDTHNRFVCSHYWTLLQKPPKNWSPSPHTTSLV